MKIILSVEHLHGSVCANISVFDMINASARSYIGKEKKNQANVLRAFVKPLAKHFLFSEIHEGFL